MRSTCSSITAAAVHVAGASAIVYRKFFSRSVP
jgi:hypothetical protein